MAVKTITITKKAYDAFASMKQANESFSDLILRVSKRKPLRDFFGALSPETGKKLENAITSSRRSRVWRLGRGRHNQSP
jgi:predicted CopG family antitoxin